MPQNGLTPLREIKQDIKARSVGSLEVSEGHQALPEPADIGIGHIGIWGKSDDQLFPHTPTIIKGKPLNLSIKIHNQGKF